MGVSKISVHMQHGESDAIACDPTRPEDCLTYCYVMDDGSMVSASSCIYHSLENYPIHPTAVNFAH